MVSTTDLPTKECRNSLSARTQPDVVSDLIEKEVFFKGFLYGPFKDPFQNYRVSPIGIAEGKYSGKKRLILDLSSPHNDDKHLSINDLIDKQDCSMSYVRIDDAIDVILKFGRNSWLANRQIPQTSSQCSTTSNEVPKQLRCNVVLNQAVNELWNSAIANTTRTVYDTGFRKFETFMLLNGFQFSNLPPISEDILIYFIAHCFKILSLQYSTIKLYLCGIRYKYVQGNQNDPLQSAHNTPLIRLDYVLNSVKRLQKTKNHIRLPITFEILEKIVNCLRKGFCSKFTDLMLRTACIVAFYGFLRCGEFTVSKASQFDPHINLCIEDVVFHSDLVVLKLKQSKTDPFRKGINIQLHKLGQLICPYTILLEYIQIRKEFSPTNQTDPLFITIDKKPLERQYFITCIKKVLDICGFNSSHYNGHSFRIGAATSAGKAKIEDHLIKT
ncbi:unnamed protein product [Mytilus edulis]|uniref:Tyr recombinase domain-containing protein n=1 Tax=Mytilus edulis TaxID=6550 RepID=A0A8S3R8T9_MYTED|nr:unnamed protein product [Mytilus edulis]